MFWTLPTWFNNLCLAVLSICFGLGFDALLSVYSRYDKSGYAFSIHWLVSSDYIESIKTVYNSRKRAPKSTVVTAGAMVFISIFLGFVSTIAVTQIDRTYELRDPITRLVKSPQITIQDRVIYSFAGWTTTKEYGSNIKDAMATLINSTRNTLDVNSKKVYTPREYAYEVKCSQLNMYLYKDNMSSLFMDNDGCMTGFINPFGHIQVNLSDIAVKKLSSNRLSLVGSASKITDLPSDIGVAAKDSIVGWPCAIYSLDPSPSSILVNGRTMPPLTTVSKCVLPSGEIRVLSISAVQFMIEGIYTNGNDTEIQINKHSFRNVTKFVFQEDDELLQAMESSINAENLKANATVFVEANTHNSSIDMVVCHSSKEMYVGLPYMPFKCAYLNLNILSLKEQKANDLIASARGNYSIPEYKNIGLFMSIAHGSSDNIDDIRVSMDTIRVATSQAGEYLAALGQNVYADYDGNQLFAIYDVYDIVDGFSAPTWLVLFMGGVALACLVFWIAVKFAIKDIYKDSLFGLVSREITLKSDTSEPHSTLKISNINPLQMGGYDIVPRENFRGLDLKEEVNDE
ncbi:hypothetical protein BGZ76_002676 [Entomortierella beljakovae]|nr:hypothetical protein BGZ76_002676 [Entomortierella beljakovae]